MSAPTLEPQPATPAHNAIDETIAAQQLPSYHLNNTGGMVLHQPIDLENYRTLFEQMIHTREVLRVAFYWAAGPLEEDTDQQRQPIVQSEAPKHETSPPATPLEHQVGYLAAARTARITPPEVQLEARERLEAELRKLPSTQINDQYLRAIGFDPTGQ